MSEEVKQFNPLEPNPQRMMQLLTDKLVNEQQVNAALQTQLEQVVQYAGGLEKELAELQAKAENCDKEDCCMKNETGDDL